MKEENEIIVNEKKKTNIGWGILGFFIPIVGLILFLVWKKNKRESAKAAGVGALIGVIFSILSLVISIRVLYGSFEYFKKTIETKDVEPTPAKTDNTKIIDITTINTSIEIKGDFRIFSDKNKTLTENEEIKFDSNELSLLLSNGKLTIKDTSEGKILKEFTGVKNVYYYEFDCSGLEFIIIETNTKTYYARTRAQDINNISYVELNGTYGFYGSMNNHSYTCGGSAVAIGAVVMTGDLLDYYADLNGEKGISVNRLFYYDSPNAYINNDREYKLGESTGKLKMVILGSEDDVLQGYIDSDNNAYSYIYSYENGKDMIQTELVKNSEVSKVKVDEENNKVTLVFENGEEYLFEYASIKY